MCLRISSQSVTEFEERAVMVARMNLRYGHSTLEFLSFFSTLDSDILHLALCKV